MIAGVALAGCGSFESKPKLVIINVLDKEYYDDCHIADSKQAWSINVPFLEIDEYAQKNLDKESEIVLYCSNYKCSASGAAARRLAKMGFKKVYAFEGGMAEWKQLGYPTKGSCQMPYLTQVVPKPDEAEPLVISAQELHQKMQEHAKV